MKPTTTTQQLLSPEVITPLVKYTLTMNPDDDHQFWGVDDRIDAVLKYFKYQVKMLSTLCNIDVYMEMSKTGRLHWHGTIEFKDYKGVKNFYLFQIHNMLKTMQIEMDTIADSEKWLTYCTKSQSLIQCHLTTADALKTAPMIKRVEYKNYFQQDVEQLDVSK